MRVLITGGAGFIGSHIADVLVERGDEVVILDDLSTGRRENIEHLIESGQVQFVEGSVLDRGLVKVLMSTVDACFHLASAVGVKLVVNRPLDSVLNSVRGADTVASSAADLGVRLLFTSTSEIYGKNGSGPLHEDSDRVLGSPTTARWSYSTAKAFGEILAYGYANERGARTVVARLFNSVGPRQTGTYGMVLPTLVRQALEGRDLTVFGDGTQTRCFTHVNDTVDALVRLIETEEANGGVFNVGCPREVSIAELARLVLERTGSDSPIRMIPYSVAYPGGFEELGRRVPDCSEIERLTGWRPSRSVVDAVDDVIAHERGLHAKTPAVV
jgi:nucleoside-diphosphate-sugar epimerase